MSCDLTELWLFLLWADVGIFLFPGAEGIGTEPVQQQNGEVALEGLGAIIIYCIKDTA